MTDLKQIAFIICTDNEQCCSECVRYIQDLEIPEGYGIDIIGIQQAESVAAAYNAGMQASNARYKVYLHQDTFILNKNFIRDILGIFQANEEIGLLGVVGAQEYPSDGSDSYSWNVGRVAFYNGVMTADVPYKQESSAAYMEVKAVHGCLMAAQYDMPWEESVHMGEECPRGGDSYHVLQSLEMQRNGYKVIVPFQGMSWCHCDGIIAKGSKETEIFRERMIRLMELGAYEELSGIVEAVRHLRLADIQVREIVNLMEIYNLEKANPQDALSTWWELRDWKQLHEIYTRIRHMVMWTEFRRENAQIEELQDMVASGIVSKTAVQKIAQTALQNPSCVYSDFEKKGRNGLRIVFTPVLLDEQYAEIADKNRVVAIADERAAFGDEIDGIPIVYPTALKRLQYDFVVILSDSLFQDKGQRQIIEKAAGEERVIPWRALAYTEEEYYSNMVDVCAELCRTYGYKTITDCDAMLKPETSFHNPLHGTQPVYDAVFVWDGYNCTDSDLETIKSRTKHIVLFTPYVREGESVKARCLNRLKPYGDVECIDNSYGLIWIVSTREFPEKNKMAIYVVMHKKYDVKSDSFYRPICVGGYREAGFLTEESGINIACLNDKINECTALYWIWKNTDTEYVGLNHYRRYFCNKIANVDNYLYQELTYEMLRRYDIILLYERYWKEQTVYQQLYDSINHELFQEGYTILRNKIQEKQPDYVDAFDGVMRGNHAYLCNMFITRRDILNQYCEWLFSFLTDAAAEINVEGYDAYSRRVMGFFAERMMTVWLRKNKLRIKELPLLYNGNEE